MLTVREVNFFELERHDWMQLVAQSDNASFFQTYDWINHWLQHFGETIERPLILLITDNDKLVGIGPFALCQSTLGFLTLSVVERQHILADYGDIIALPGYEEKVWLSLLIYLQSLAKDHHYHIELDYLREGSISQIILHEMQWLARAPIEKAPRIPLPKEEAQYWRLLSSHARHEVKRKVKHGVANGMLPSQVAISANAIDTFALLIQKTNEQKQQFYSTAILNFIIDLLQLSCVNLLFLKQNTTVIASLITFHYKNEILAYNSTYDLSFRQLSPGIVLFQWAILQAITEKKQFFDFLRGNEPYKYTFGALDRTLYTLRSSSCNYEGYIP